MSESIRVDAEPYGCPAMRIGEKPDVHDTFRGAGPIAEARAPGNGKAWVVTDLELARAVLNDPKFVKNPQLAPESWHGEEFGVDRPKTELWPYTMLAVDGEEHRRLRRIHAPGFSPGRLAARADRIAEIARDLLTGLAEESASDGKPADLISGVAYHFPLLVICEMLGVPVTDPVSMRRVVSALKALGLGASSAIEPDAVALEEVLAEAVRSARRNGSDTMTRTLYQRALKEFGTVTDEQLVHMITGLIFAGHDTTGSFLGFLMAEILAGRLPDGAGEDEVHRFVQEALRVHPPVPYTLWRFAATEITLAGVTLPRGAPILVDIENLNSDERLYEHPHTFRPLRTGTRHFTFGQGPHQCIGEQLALLESRILVDVLRNRFPDARLAVPYEELRWHRRGAQTAQLTRLPAWLERSW